MLTGVLVGSICTGLVAAFGLYRLYQYYKFYQHVYSRNAWPAAAGKVVGGHTGYTPGTRGGRYYYAMIEYDYLAQGMKRMGTIKKNVLWGERQASGILKRYPPDSNIEIHYNPAQPDEHVSTLDKSRTYLVVSLILFIWGLLGVTTAFTIPLTSH